MDYGPLTIDHSPLAITDSLKSSCISRRNSLAEQSSRGYDVNYD